MRASAFATFLSVLFLLLPSGGFAQAAAETAYDVEGGQISVPEGVTLMVKKITVGTDATIVNVLLSYDGDSTSVDMTSDPTYLELPDGQRLFLRPIKDNPELEIEEGQSLQGDLVFPGAVPAGTESVTLVMNEGNDGDDIAAPGIVLPLKLKATE